MSTQDIRWQQRLSNYNKALHHLGAHGLGEVKLFEKKAESVLFRLYHRDKGLVQVVKVSVGANQGGS